MATNLKHPVYDTDTHFTIDPISREMSNTACLKSCLIQHDHNSERFTFEVPKAIEGHDMSQCDSIQVHYINIDSQTKEQSAGVYEVDDMMLTEDPSGDRIYFSWLISHNATEHVGSLSFLIRFSCFGDDGYLAYVWNTAIYSGISISNGIDNGEVIIDDYADILNEWRKETEAFRLLSLEQTQTSTESEGVNIWTATFADGTTINFEVRNGAQGEPGAAQDLTNYVQFTNLAAVGGDPGIVKLYGNDYGLTVKNGYLALIGASYKALKRLTGNNAPITPANLTVATKMGLLSNANHLDELDDEGVNVGADGDARFLSNTEKAAIAEWLDTGRIVSGSYEGTGDTTKHLPVEGQPLIVFIGLASVTGTANHCVAVRGQGETRTYSSTTTSSGGVTYAAALEWSDTEIVLTPAERNAADSVKDAIVLNRAGYTYNYVFIYGREEDEAAA